MQFPAMHTSLIEDADYERIKKSCDFLDGIDLEAARYELGNIKRRYDAVRLSQVGIDGEHRLSLLEIKTMLDSITGETQEHIDKITNTYSVSIGEDDWWDITPEWLGPVFVGLSELQESAKKLSTEGLAELIKTGTDKDLAYPELIESLFDWYGRHTGVVGTCKNVKKYKKGNADGNVDVDPTKYQCFVESCARAFAIEINKTFHNNTQKLTDALKKERRKALVTAKTC
jgi:hypothetical protein